MVVDDYGHHPEEIRATLAAAKGGWDRRLVVVFQPHRYSRTRDLFDDFVTAFNEADILILTGIYPAGESPIEGISGARLFEAIERHGHRDVSFVADRMELPSYLTGKAKRGDLIITMGAGNIYEAGDLFLEELKERNPLKVLEKGAI